MDPKHNKYSDAGTEARGEAEPKNELSPALPIGEEDTLQVSDDRRQSEVPLPELKPIPRTITGDEVEPELKLNAPPGRDMPSIEDDQDQVEVSFRPEIRAPFVQQLKPDSPVKERPSDAVLKEVEPDKAVQIEEQPREAVTVEEQQQAVPEPEHQQQPDIPFEDQHDSIDDNISSMSSPLSSIHSSDEDDIPLINFYRPGVRINDPRGAQVIYVPGRYPEGVARQPPRPERPRLIPRTPSLSEDSSSSPEMPTAVRKRRRRFDGQR